MWHKRISSIELEATKIVELEKVFELPVSKHREIKKSRQENKLLKMVWDMVSVTKHSFADWKKALWNDIDPEGLLSVCTKLQKQQALLPKDMRGWKAYTGSLFIRHLSL